MQLQVIFRERLMRLELEVLPTELRRENLPVNLAKLTCQEQKGHLNPFVYSTPLFGKPSAFIHDKTKWRVKGTP